MTLPTTTEARRDWFAEKAMGYTGVGEPGCKLWLYKVGSGCPGMHPLRPPHSRPRDRVDARVLLGVVH
jgi:hypothetical protein